MTVREVVLETDFLERVINLDWTLTFRRDGVLVHYDLTRNGVLLTRSTATSIALPREPVGMSESSQLATSADVDWEMKV